MVLIATYIACWSVKRFGPMQWGKTLEKCCSLLVSVSLMRRRHSQFISSSSYHQQTRKLISSLETSHEHNNKDLSQSPMVILSWHASRYKVHKLHKYNLVSSVRSPGLPHSLNYKHIHCGTETGRKWSEGPRTSSIGKLKRIRPVAREAVQVFLTGTLSYSSDHSWRPRAAVHCSFSLWLISKEGQICSKLIYCETREACLVFAQRAFCILNTPAARPACR